MPIATRVPLEEYLQTEYEPDCDYVDGALEDRNVGKKRHSRTQQRTILVLSPRVAPHGLEPLPEQRIQISTTKVRIPDICLCAADDDEEVMHRPPPLCIEILSPEDRLSRLLKIVADYIAFGVPVIWIVDPYNREAFVVTQQNPTLQQVDELRWNDVVVQLNEILPE